MRRLVRWTLRNLRKRQQIRWIKPHLIAVLRYRPRAFWRPHIVRQKAVSDMLLYESEYSKSAESTNTPINLAEEFYKGHAKGRAEFYYRTMLALKIALLTLFGGYILNIYTRNAQQRRMLSQIENDLSAQRKSLDQFKLRFGSHIRSKINTAEIYADRYGPETFREFALMEHECKFAMLQLKRILARTESMKNRRWFDSTLLFIPFFGRMYEKSIRLASIYQNFDVCRILLKEYKLYENYIMVAKHVLVRNYPEALKILRKIGTEYAGTSGSDEEFLSIFKTAWNQSTKSDNDRQALLDLLEWVGFIYLDYKVSLPLHGYYNIYTGCYDEPDDGSQKEWAKQRLLKLKELSEERYLGDTEFNSILSSALPLLFNFGYGHLLSAELKLSNEVEELVAAEECFKEVLSASLLSPMPYYGMGRLKQHQGHCQSVQQRDLELCRQAKSFYTLAASIDDSFRPGGRSISDIASDLREDCTSASVKPN